MSFQLDRALLISPDIAFSETLCLSDEDWTFLTYSYRHLIFTCITFTVARLRTQPGRHLLIDSGIICLSFLRSNGSTMTMDSNWSPDYCLSCDRQTSGGVYCSQVCRLADLETASCDSEPASPTSPGRSSFWASSTSPSTAGFYLQPAFDFSTFRSTKSRSSSDFHQAKSAYHTSYFSTDFHTQTPPIPLHPPSKRILTPSSSQSSLTSMQSKASQKSGLSAQAKTELRSYTNSFDLIRNWRRRMNPTG